ncbi:MAG TPA: peptidylprolyl isomerase, partial [Tepidisphaeraceae bacterium]
SPPATQATVAQTPSDPVRPSDDPVIARVGNTEIRSSELQGPLLRAFGFDVLMYVVQRDLARDACVGQGLTVSPKDFAAEREWTLNQMFTAVPEGQTREKLLDQFLAQPKPRDQMRTTAEFDVLIETNTYLRKLAEKAFRRSLTEEDVRRQFDQTYGAHVKARHIMVSNMQEAMSVKARLAAGEEFAAVAKAVSRNPNTAPKGGELPQFTKFDKRIPENFRNVAFALNEGDISDPVAAEGSYHVIKLDQRVEPKAVKFEDVKESVRDDLEAALVIEGIKEVRNQLAAQALAELKISDPVLKAEFTARLQARDQVIRDREKIKQEMTKRRLAPDPTTTAAVPPGPGTAPVPPQVSPPPPPPATQTAPPPPAPAAVPNPVAPPPPGPTPPPAPPVPPATQPAPPPADAPPVLEGAAEPPAPVPASPAPATQP